MAVVLGLYPIILIQERLFGYLGVTLGVMPLIIRLLGFWFKPDYQPSSLRAEAAGTVLTVVAMGLMALLFERV